jgi:hypothetical protein
MVCQPTLVAVYAVLSFTGSTAEDAVVTGGRPKDIVV